jgi:hypothetical protein
MHQKKVLHDKIDTLMGLRKNKQKTYFGTE